MNIDSPNGRIIHLLLKHCQDQKKRADFIEKVMNATGVAEEIHAQDAKYKGVFI